MLGVMEVSSCGREVAAAASSTGLGKPSTGGVAAGLQKLSYDGTLHVDKEFDGSWVLSYQLSLEKHVIMGECLDLEFMPGGQQALHCVGVGGGVVVAVAVGNKATHKNASNTTICGVVQACKTLLKQTSAQ